MVDRLAEEDGIPPPTSSDSWKDGGRGGDIIITAPTGEVTGESGAVVVKLEGPASGKVSFLSAGDLTLVLAVGCCCCGCCCESGTDFFLERFGLKAPTTVCSSPALRLGWGDPTTLASPAGGLFVTLFKRLLCLAAVGTEGGAEAASSTGGTAAGGC